MTSVGLWKNFIAIFMGDSQELKALVKRTTTDVEIVRTRLIRGACRYNYMAATLL